MSLSKNDSSDDSFRSIQSSYMGDGSETTSKIGEIIKHGNTPALIKRETSYMRHASDRFKRIESFFAHNQLTDVTLIAGDKIIHAHRIILSASSDYFAAMFMNNLRESNEREIKFPEMDGEILRKLVNFCYTGVIEMHEDTVESILTSSSILQLNEVTEKCCNFMSNQLHPSNCIGIYLFADRQGCQVLKEDADYYIKRYFMDVIQNQEFLDTPEDEVCKLLSSDDLNVPCEDEIFQALMKWVEYNVVERTRNIGKLLALVRLPLLQPSFIVDHIQTKAILRDDPTCQVLIMEALNYHLLPERRPQLQNSRTHPRKSTVGTLLAIGGMDSFKGAVSIEEFDNRLCTWYPVGNMSGRRLQFGAAVINNKLFVVGGRDGLKTLNTAECLDLKTMIWSNLPTMSTSRHGLGVAVLGGPLYAIGGHDGWSYLNSVERWDSDLRQWSYVAPMSFARSTASVAVLNNKIYAVGGRDGSSCLKFVEMYDPHTNKWSLCSPMIRKRGAVGVGVLNGYLYAVGGHDAPANNPSAARFECVERYDPKTDSWSIIANMSLGRDSVGVCVLGDQLFAIGGYDGQSYLSLVETYDPITNEWKTISPLNTGRAGACVVAIKSRISSPTNY